jgi:hypothetical protein
MLSGPIELDRSVTEFAMALAQPEFQLAIGRMKRMTARGFRREGFQYPDAFRRVEFHTEVSP